MLDTSRIVATAIGELCIDADWACEQGDFVTLREIAAQLEAYVPEPLHCKLRELADACASDPEHATELWAEIKDRVYRA